MNELEQLWIAASAACEGRPPAHDLGHVERVTALARRIAEAEGARLDVVVPAAVLHELVNLPKGHPESARSGDLCAVAADEVLRAAGVPADRRGAIVACIRDHAFSKGAAPSTLEVAVLQDADRLDALGAVGVARCFATCTELGRPLFAAEDPFCDARAPDDRASGLDHFFRKLLRLEAGMHTPTGRALAAPRAAFLRATVDQLRRELSPGGDSVTQ